jgi:salicylate hydroxylase
MTGTTNITKRKKQRLSKTSTKIAIIGTGPAALSSALSLQKAGFQSITLYERDAHFDARKDGYGLTLTYNPSSSIHSPLEKLGILEDLARKDCPSRAHYVFHSQGRVLGYYGNEFSNQSRGLGQRGNLRVPRQMLRRTMMDTLLERDEGRAHVKIEWGRKLLSYSQMKNSVNTNKYENDENNDCLNEENPIVLHFEDGTSAGTDFLVGADGVRSVVIKKLISNSTNKDKDYSDAPPPIENPKRNPTDLSYLGIMIILGISKDFFHPLLDERGFYTLDGDHRLFTMPFEGSRLDDLEQYDIPINDQSVNIKRTRRYMWQLSYNLDYEKAVALSKGGPKGIVDEVLNRTINWHDPVQQMIRCTPLETVWGTPLMDRNPRAVLDTMKQKYNANSIPDNELRTIVMGDAVHPMSPFKGQGANQSLMDGPLLCSWIEKSNLNSCVNGFMRDMVQRTEKKVRASREAAQFLHSDAVLSHKESFAGVQTNSIELLLNTLHERNISANAGGLIDGQVAKVIQELGIHDEKSKNTTEGRNEGAEREALAFSAKGDLANIRKLSMKYPESIRMARHPETGDTCLHLAARAGCYHTVKWLLAEACADHTTLDNKKQSILHAAVWSGNCKLVSLISKYCAKSQECWQKNDDGISPIDLIYSVHENEKHQHDLKLVMT